MAKSNYLCLILLALPSAIADLRIAAHPMMYTNNGGNGKRKDFCAFKNGNIQSGMEHGCLYLGPARAIWPNTTLPRNKFCITPGDSRFPGGNKQHPGHCFIGPYSGKDKTKIVYKWAETSTFDYRGLIDQKNNNYDQFLRSNIDNEQDNRNFLREDGHDHLPFRTWNSQVKSQGTSGPQINRNTGIITTTMEAGDSRILPLTWNNPHASELEINIWIQDHSAGKPIVVPIRRPTCKGEGYNSNVVKFTIPSDFGELGSKIPGFKGCNKDSEPLCVVQIYAHSVESRQYSSAFPIIITGSTSASTASIPDIEAVAKDPWLDLTPLRELCRPNNDPEADIKTAVPRWARLVSDVYNHAYQNSDFSPYSGQQHESISQNLQASAINKMVTGNRGELGRGILPKETMERIGQLQAMEDRIYKNYEALANKIILKLGDKMKNTAVYDTTRPEKGEKIEDGKRDGNLRVVNEYCFRCAEVGSISLTRVQTNTYIPSYQLPSNLISSARSMLPSKYADLINPTGQVRIYVQTLLALLPFFVASHPYGIIYQQAMIKDTLLTMHDATKFKKIDAQGKTDYRSYYASMRAKEKVAESFGCPMKCLKNAFQGKPFQGGKSLISKANLKDTYGNMGTKVTGDCCPCRAFFNGFGDKPAFKPELTLLAKDMITAGMPKGFAVDLYPDSDGSPRIGRPIGENDKNKTAIEIPGQPDWASQLKSGGGYAPLPPSPGDGGSTDPCEPLNPQPPTRPPTPKATTPPTRPPTPKATTPPPATEPPTPLPKPTRRRRGNRRRRRTGRNGDARPAPRRRRRRRRRRKN